MTDSAAAARCECRREKCGKGKTREVEAIAAYGEAGLGDSRACEGGSNSTRMKPKNKQT